MVWYFCPTQVFFAPHALKDNSAALSPLGKRCLVVTGKTSAAASGALDDLMELLPSLGISYEVFDEVEPNPSITTCSEGGRRARAFGAAFIIGAGGGSALDAAKAIAAYAAGNMSPMAIYDPLPTSPLPVAAIPTTAGTGSEVNGYAVLTIPDLGIKRTFSSPAVFPTAAFLDPRYTASLPSHLTIGTALDAFCHCAESYFSPSATVLTRALCIKGADQVWRGLLAAQSGAPDEEARHSLLAGALLGGMSIAHTGTGYPHPMGYNLSLYHGLSHGAACAVFEGGYLRRQAAASPQLYAEFMQFSGLPDDLPAQLRALAGPVPRLSADEIARYAGLIAGARNFTNSIAPVGNDPGAIAELYHEMGLLD